MERINRPEDDFRETLTLDQINEICTANGLPAPAKIEPERRGNEKVIYHLDDTYSLQFMATQEDVDDLLLLGHFDEYPSPAVLAWCENDASVETSVLITEKCTGDRLDVLWNRTGDAERLQLLEDFGSAMARYHAIDPQRVVSTAEAQGLSHRVTDTRENPVGSLDGRRRSVENGIDSIEGLLRFLDPNSTDVMPALNRHLRTKPCSQLLPVGLVHGEPWAEHYLISLAASTYTLTGAVDISGLKLRDPASEIVIIHASILDHSDAWFSAFRKGYDKVTPSPDNAASRLHGLAIDFGAWALLSLSGEWDGSDYLKRGHPYSDWYKRRAADQYLRLRVWLGLEGGSHDVLFRADIGPW